MSRSKRLFAVARRRNSAAMPFLLPPAPAFVVMRTARCVCKPANLPLVFRGAGHDTLAAQFGDSGRTFSGEQPPQKSNFYCHPGRAGGTPITLGNLRYNLSSSSPPPLPCGSPVAASLALMPCSETKGLFLMVPHCLKKGATPSSSQSLMMSRIQVACVGLAPWPLSPPAINQSGCRSCARSRRIGPIAGS